MLGVTRRFGATLVIWTLCALLSPLAIAQDTAPLPAVTVAQASMEVLEQTASFSGRLVASRKVDIRARVSGFLEEVHFEGGAQVSTGDPLFSIEDEVYAAAVAEINGLISSAEAERRLAELERERTQRLVERGTLAQADLDRADAALGQAEGNIARLEAQLRTAELNLTYTTIEAPFEGTVGLSEFDPGALISPESGPLVTLTDLDPVYAEFSVSTALFLAVRSRAEAQGGTQEAEVSIILPDGSEHPEPGKVTFVDAQVASGTDTILVRAEFANPDDRLFDGALVLVRFVETQADARLAVPAQAVQRDLAGPFVLTVDASGMVGQTRVETGISQRGLIEITDGLSEGALVITEGINKARPGIKVDAATAEGN